MRPSVEWSKPGLAKKGVFWQSLVAGKGDLLGLVVQEHGVSSRSAALCTHPGARVWLAASTPDGSGLIVLLIAINILLFPQGFCKKRAGFKTLSVFLLSHPLPWKEVVGSPGELVQVLGYP